MTRLALAAVGHRLQGLTELSWLGWFCVFFVAWASATSAVRGDVFGVVLALGLLLLGFRYFGPSLRRSGGRDDT